MCAEYIVLYTAWHKSGKYFINFGKNYDVQNYVTMKYVQNKEEISLVCSIFEENSFTSITFNKIKFLIYFNSLRLITTMYFHFQTQLKLKSS